jgi:CelD/BcsL family acetyltransferase involved in cellulose biosynthesis
MRIDCSVFDRVDDALKEKWKSLEARAFITVNQSWEWHASWCLHGATTFNEKPYIVALSHKDKLIAIFPFAISKYFGTNVFIWFAHFQNAYNFPLVDDAWQSEIDAELVQKIFRLAGRDQPQVSMFYLTGQCERLGEYVNRLYEFDHSSHCHNSWQIQVPQETSFESFFRAQMKGKRRKELRRQESQLRKLDASFSVAISHEEQVGLLQWIMEVREETSELNVASKNEAEKSALFNFLRHVIENGDEVRFIHVCLKIGGEIVSAYNGPVYKDTFLALTTASRRDKSSRLSLGSISLKNLIRYLVEVEKVTLIDFGPGESLQKKVWDAEPIQRFNAYFPLNLRGKILRQWINIFYRAKQTAKKIRCKIRTVQM